MGDLSNLSFLVRLVPFVTIIFLGCSSTQFSGNTGYLHFTTIARIPVIEARINGKDAWFIIDSGASCSLLNESAAEHFNFKFNGLLNEHVHSLNGDAKLNRATNCKIDLGPLRISHHMFHTKEMGAIVSAIEEREDITISGIIGADILRQFKITLDFGNNVLLFPVPKGKVTSMYARQTSWSQRVRALD